VPKRPDLNRAVRILLRWVTKQMPEFAHLKPSRILVVSGEARRASHASVKPLAFERGRRTDAIGRHKPLVKVNGRRILYCITLRPLFFRKSNPRHRVATILHELFHISKAFDGTLDDAHRHEQMGKKFEKRFRPLERRLWASLPPRLVSPFAYDGEVRVLQWLERPGAWLSGEKHSMRRLYTEEHLFSAIVRMKKRAVKAAAQPVTSDRVH
jgi:hypothetical protein